MKQRKFIPHKEDQHFIKLQEGIQTLKKVDYSKIEDESKLLQTQQALTRTKKILQDSKSKNGLKYKISKCTVGVACVGLVCNISLIILVSPVFALNLLFPVMGLTFGISSIKYNEELNNIKTSCLDDIEKLLGEIDNAIQINFQNNNIFAQKLPTYILNNRARYEFQEEQSKSQNTKIHNQNEHTL